MIIKNSYKNLIKNLERSYAKLVKNIRKTYENLTTNLGKIVWKSYEVSKIGPLLDYICGSQAGFPVAFMCALVMRKKVEWTTLIEYEC